MAWIDFLQLLRKSEIGVVIDVRSRPRSRWPHFSHPALRTALNAPTSEKVAADARLLALVSGSCILTSGLSSETSEGSSMLTLYFAPGASSMAPHIALHEIGAPFDGRPISLARKEARSPEYLAVNPEGKVPTLVIDGRPLTEVAAILFYLARRYPEAGLLPVSDIEQEAQVVSWMSFAAATLHPARRQGLDHARRIFGLAERRLSDREWAIGQYSIADIHLFRLFWRFRGGYEAAEGEFPGLEGHYRRMRVRPAVQKTLAAESAVGYELPG
jgi:glutathione S-transferase